VILPDVNLLIYAVDTASPDHSAARQWLEKQLSGPGTLAFSWLTLLAFVRLTTRARVFEMPYSMAEAFQFVDSWLALPSTVIIHPGDRHHVVLREMLEAVGTAGNLVPDAHLAALAIEHGAILATADRDFGRFPRVRVFNPLTGSSS